VSSAGEYARRKLRECDGLVDSLLYVMRCAIEKSNIGNKSMENCVCILRNLSYRCQEIEDENYDKQPFPAQPTRQSAPQKGENLGCFGASKKKKESVSGATSGSSANPKESTRTPRNTGEPYKGMDLLWQPEVSHCFDKNDNKNGRYNNLDNRNLKSSIKFKCIDLHPCRISLRSALNWARKKGMSRRIFSTLFRLQQP